MSRCYYCYIFAQHDYVPQNGYYTHTYVHIHIPIKTHTYVCVYIYVYVLKKDL